MAPNIRYGDRSDNVTCPDLIGNERTSKVRTLTRRHANAGCPCGSWIAGNDQKWGCYDGRRDRQGLNDASSSVNVEHGSVIHPREMIGNPRFRHSGHMANLSRQWKVAELLRRSSDTASRRSPLDDGRQMDGSIHTATVIGVDCVEPPADPNEWNDEQWLEWLKATDDAPFDDSEESISEVVMRIVRSTPGLVIGQSMLGMAQAIYGRQNDEVVVVVEDNGETTDDKPFAVRLDFDHPERSLVEFKPGSNSPT